MLLAQLFNAGPTAIIDHVAKHLLIDQRGVAAADDDKCMYRLRQGDDTLMCAAGCMFDDADYAAFYASRYGVYDAGPEHKSFCDLQSNDPKLAQMLSDDQWSTHRKLVTDLQSEHDRLASASSGPVSSDAWYVLNVAKANEVSVTEMRARLWLRAFRVIAAKFYLHDAWVLTDDAYQAVYGYAEVK